MKTIMKIGSSAKSVRQTAAARIWPTWSRLLLLLVCVFVASPSAFAEGALNFSNGATGVNAPVPLSATSATNATAELLVVAASVSGVSITNGVPVQTGELAGYFFGGNVEIPNSTAGQSATVQVRIWNSNQIVALSAPVEVVLGGGIAPPTNLVGLQFPASPTLRARKETVLIILSWDVAFSQFTPEFMNKYGEPWTALPQNPTVEGGEFQVIVTPDFVSQYFRLRSRQPTVP